jgi:penicillin-binding protein 2
VAISLGPSHDARTHRPSNHFAFAVVMVGIVALTARLLAVQGLGGERYEKYAAIERVSKVPVTAPRGLVKGRDGTVMARNVESHRLEVLTHRLKPERIGDLVAALRTLTDMTDADAEQLATDLAKPVDPRKRRPLVVRRDLVSMHCPYDSSTLELIAAVPHAFCRTCGRGFEPVPERKTCPFDQRRLVAQDGGGWRCTVCEREFHDGAACPYDRRALHKSPHNLRCPLCRRTFNDEVATLRAGGYRMPELRVVAEIQREYPYRYLASHVVGYMGYAQKDDVARLLPWGPTLLGAGDRVGRAGIEKAFDWTLRGIDGEQVRVHSGGQERDGKGYGELVQVAQPRATVAGTTLHLTLDLDLQRAVKVALKDVFAGAAVVLDARSGEVLALYSKPSVDPNTMSGKRTLQGKRPEDLTAWAPLIHRALHPFPPASVYKVVAAIAALEQGVVSPRTTFHCPGHYEFGGRRFHCHDRHGHGDVDLHAALSASCDVYFYHLGELLGIDQLERYARVLGFGQPTGIEIPERVGRVPSRAWYESHVKGGYLPGFALSTAVGQKDVTTTPLQVALVYAGIARMGAVPRASLIAGFEDAGGKLRPVERVPPSPWPVRRQTLEVVRAGLYAVVHGEGGTAPAARSDLVALAGKTGTAQAAQRPRRDLIDKLRDDPGTLHRLASWMQNDHAWFVGYGPTRDPDVVVVVLIEHGGSGGHNAAPIARQIAEAWFKRHAPTSPETPDTVLPKERPPSEQRVRDPVLSPSVTEPDGASAGDELPGEPATVPEPPADPTPEAAP